MSNDERQTLELTFAEDILNLDNLVNLTFDGQCCIEQGATIPTARYVYSADTDFTYSTDALDPEIVCSSLSGPQQTQCLNTVSDENGDAKVIAHRGIELYYGFAPGQVSGVCTGFQACSL